MKHHQVTICFQLENSLRFIVILDMHQLDLSTVHLEVLIRLRPEPATWKNYIKYLKNVMDVRCLPRNLTAIDL